jgi:hypothetical protein
MELGEGTEKFTFIRSIIPPMGSASAALPCDTKEPSIGVVGLEEVLYFEQVVYGTSHVPSLRHRRRSSSPSP